MLSQSVCLINKIIEYLVDRDPWRSSGPISIWEEDN